MAPPKTEACAALCDDVAESVHPNFDLLSKHGAEVKNTADAMVGGWVPSSPRSFAVKHQAMTPRIVRVNNLTHPGVAATLGGRVVEDTS
jgi:hypothetical protein